jgi:hypothetical protein
MVIIELPALETHTDPETHVHKHSLPHNGHRAIRKTFSLIVVDCRPVLNKQLNHKWFSLKALIKNTLATLSKLKKES